MKEYEVVVTEKMVSTVYVEAENEDEACALAMKTLAKDFYAPYHDSVDVTEYEVIEC